MHHITDGSDSSLPVSSSTVSRRDARGEGCVAETEAFFVGLVIGAGGLAHRNGGTSQ